MDARTAFKFLDRGMFTRVAGVFSRVGLMERCRNFLK
jgi:hypothetical protein